MNQTESELNQVKSERSVLSDNYSTLSNKYDSILENLKRATSELTTLREVLAYPELISAIPVKEELPDGPWETRWKRSTTEPPSYEVAGASPDLLEAWGFEVATGIDFSRRYGPPWIRVGFIYVSFESMDGAESAINRWEERFFEPWMDNYEVYPVAIADEAFGYYVKRVYNTHVSCEDGSIQKRKLCCKRKDGWRYRERRFPALRRNSGGQNRKYLRVDYCNYSLENFDDN